MSETTNIARNHYGDFVVFLVCMAGLCFGIGEWVGRTGVEPTVKPVQVCSPRSIDAYSPRELRSIAIMRERLGRTK